MTNSRNQYGVKSSADCYRNIAGSYYEQWSDFYEKDGHSLDITSKEKRDEALTFHKSENPTKEFKAIKIKDGSYRIYAKVG